MATLVVASRFVPWKNSTWLIVPSTSLASATILMSAGLINRDPSAGVVMVTVGGTFALISSVALFVTEPQGPLTTTCTVWGPADSSLVWIIKLGSVVPIGVPSRVHSQTIGAPPVTEVENKTSSPRWTVVSLNSLAAIEAGMLRVALLVRLLNGPLTSTL